MESLSGISGLLFHTLCELNADALERTLAVIEEKFGKTLSHMKWINFGGGHHITRADYNLDLLCRIIRDFRSRYNLEVYLEPGEAVALNAGVLVASVLDIVRKNVHIAILDTSASTHMPDVLEMPYRPNIEGAGMPGEKPHTYRLGGPSCLAGDIIGDYSFSKPLEIGSKLIFLDMAHYSMVKTTTFNGIKLPSIAGARDRRAAWRAPMKRLALYLLTALASACSPGAEPTVVRSEGLEIRAAVDPETARVGDNQLLVELRDADGNPVEGAALDVKVQMHAMGAMPAMGGVAHVAELGGGRYQAHFALEMGGTWQVEVEARPPSGPMARAEGSLTVGTPGLRLEAVGAASEAPPAGHVHGGVSAPTGESAEFRCAPERLRSIRVRTALATRRTLTPRPGLGPRPTPARSPTAT